MKLFNFDFVIFQILRFRCIFFCTKNIRVFVYIAEKYAIFLLYRNK